MLLRHSLSDQPTSELLSWRLRPPLPRKLHRRSQRGYRCSYDCTEIYRDDEEDEDDDDDNDDDRLF